MVLASEDDRAPTIQVGTVCWLTYHHLFSIAKTVNISIVIRGTLNPLSTKDEFLIVTERLALEA